MGFTRTVLSESDVPHFRGTRIPIRLTIYFKMVRSWHLRLCSKSMEHGLTNSTVNHGSLSEISLRGEPWSQKGRVSKDTSTALGFDQLYYSNKMYHLAESVNKHKNTIILVVVFKDYEDEVH